MVDPTTVDTVRAEVVVCNRKGLHARASAKFVRCAESFDAEVTVRRDDEVVGGTSIMGLMSLAAGPGVTIVIEAKGRDATRALAELRSLVECGFGEDH